MILGIYYFGQDERVRDEAAVKRALQESCRWVLEHGFTDVVIEVNNEADVSRYEHEILSLVFAPFIRVCAGQSHQSRHFSESGFDQPESQETGGED